MTGYTTTTTTTTSELPNSYVATQAIPPAGTVVSHQPLSTEHHITTTTSPGPLEHHQSRITSTPYGESYTQETRKVSSVVLESTVLGEIPQQDNVRYVEVPTVEEQVKIVTKKEVREVERYVTRPEIEYVERVVVVPKTEYVDKIVEVPRVEYVDKQVKVPQVITVPREVKVEKKVVVPRVVEQTREVPGQVIEVPKPYTVEKPVEVIRESRREVPVIVAQTIRPVITESSTQMVVDAYHYEPEIVPVDVHLARPINSALEIGGKIDERHRVVSITAAQYNAILRSLNAGADERVYKTLPFISEHGQVPFCAEHEASYIVAPEHIKIEGYNRPMIPQHVHQLTREAEPTIMASMHSQAVPRGGRCCGNGKRNANVNTTTSVQQRNTQPSVVVTHPATSSLPIESQQRTVTGDHTILYEEPQHTMSTHHTRSMGHIPAEGGSINSQVHVVPSQQGTIQPHQKSRVCC
eukprot:Blabericola_migrator_1__1800@NODE_1489_length_4433_cov_646_042602_g977_i0_p2_GENE_NODE_1489_length_4433_cov_646_042602_g977_i0NODE_1489_length_4433_cov_646_042602_g977_i0_p2_ORF_typecomplete_len546_score68_11IMCp/PF12314_8/0_097IMCp/PF12314_8/1_8e06IMCp/PF12314_8/1_8e04CspB_prodomain/PF18425_1/43CspB_prodomain/PF18425_1/59_NODE_1489_length_4433_cov_646_042602_g977_i02431640